MNASNKWHPQMVQEGLQENLGVTAFNHFVSGPIAITIPLFGSSDYNFP